MPMPVLCSRMLLGVPVSRKVVDLVEAAGEGSKQFRRSWREASIEACQA